MVLPLIAAAAAGAAVPSLGRALSQPIDQRAIGTGLGLWDKPHQLPYAMQDGIGRNPLGGPTTAPIHHNFNPSIADSRTPQQQMQDSQNFIGGLVGSVANLPGVRQTPLRLAGDLASTLLNSGALNPYNHVKY